MGVIGPPIGDFFRGPWREAELGKESARHRHRLRVSEERPAFEVMPTYANKIGRGTGAGPDRVLVDLVRLEAPDSDLRPRITLQAIAD